MNETTYTHNLQVLQKHYPAIARKLAQPTSRNDLAIIPSKDGSVCYVRKTGNTAQALTNRINPAQKTEQVLQSLQSQLENPSKPILFVGFYPGLELPYLFKHSELVRQHEGIDQTLLICIDSLLHLECFLRCWNVTDIIASKRTHWFLHDTTDQMLQEYDHHSEWPTNFTLVSLAPDPVLQSILKPFIEFAQKRQQKLETLMEANEDYYNQLSNQELAKTLSGKGSRAPRILIPSCTTSTVIQYCIRDIAEACEVLDWETCILQSAATIPPYQLVKTIHDFHPDMLLFINHLRTEALEAYPKNLLFVTWIQDTIPAVNSTACAKAWNEWIETHPESPRDYLAGYTTQLIPYGYPRNRLINIPMIVNLRIFMRQHDDTPESEHNESTTVCFASNRSNYAPKYCQTRLLSLLAPYGMSESLLLQIYSHLKKGYEAEASYTSYQELLERLNQLPEFSTWFSTLSGEDQDHVSQLLYWRLNDLLYRQTVLQWIMELDYPLDLYGKGWERHPQFTSCAQGAIQHGLALRDVYANAKYSLHLNCDEKDHQRVYEILASGGHPLTRQKPATSSDTAPYSLIQACLDDTFRDMPQNEYERCCNHLARFAKGIIKAGNILNPQEAETRVYAKLSQHLLLNTIHEVQRQYCSTFNSKEELRLLLQDDSPQPANPGKAALSEFLPTPQVIFNVLLKNIFPDLAPQTESTIPDSPVLTHILDAFPLQQYVHMLCQLMDEKTAIDIQDIPKYLPNSIRLWLASRQYKLGNLQAASKLASSLEAVDLSDSADLQEFGTLLLHMNDQESIERWFKYLETQHLTNLFFPSVLKAYTHRQPDKIIALVESYLGKTDLTGKQHHQYAEILFKKHRDSEAIEYVRRGYQLQPDLVDGFIPLVRQRPFGYSNSLIESMLTEDYNAKHLSTTGMLIFGWKLLLNNRDDEARQIIQTIPEGTYPTACQNIRNFIHGVLETQDAYTPPTTADTEKLFQPFAADLVNSGLASQNRPAIWNRATQQIRQIFNTLAEAKNLTGKGWFTLLKLTILSHDDEQMFRYLCKQPLIPPNLLLRAQAIARIYLFFTQQLEAIRRIPLPPQENQKRTRPDELVLFSLANAICEQYDQALAFTSELVQHPESTVSIQSNTMLQLLFSRLLAFLGCTQLADLLLTETMLQQPAVILHKQWLTLELKPMMAKINDQLITRIQQFVKTLETSMKETA